MNMYFQKNPATPSGKGPIGTGSSAGTSINLPSTIFQTVPPPPLPVPVPVLVLVVYPVPPSFFDSFSALTWAWYE